MHPCKRRVFVFVQLQRVCLRAGTAAVGGAVFVVVVCVCVFLHMPVSFTSPLHWKSFNACALHWVKEGPQLTAVSPPPLQPR